MQQRRRLPTRRTQGHAACCAGRPGASPARLAAHTGPLPRCAHLPAAVVERRTTAGGAEYIRVVLGTSGGTASEVEDPSAVLDAEFLFLAGKEKKGRGWAAPALGAPSCLLPFPISVLFLFFLSNCPQATIWSTSGHHRGRSPRAGWAAAASCRCRCARASSLTSEGGRGRAGATRARVCTCAAGRSGACGCWAALALGMPSTLRSCRRPRPTMPPPACALRRARRNVARREMERLRTALNWELAPVIADFSPAFNAEAPTIFDKARQG